MQLFPHPELDPALQPGQERQIRTIVEFDWDRDSTWDGPAAMVTDDTASISLDDQVSAGLPDEVNGMISSSSTQLTVTLVGTDSVSGLPYWRLFSPFLSSSPFLGRDLSGAAVKVSAIVQSATTDLTGNPVKIRLFTGWVRSITPSRSTGTVTITGANHLHLQGRTVTLPRWARHVPLAGSPVANAGSTGPDQDVGENAPLSFAWLFQYVLRQCDALPGPGYRPTTVWYSSASGGLLPEIARYSDYVSSQSYMAQGYGSYAYPPNWHEPTNEDSVLSHDGQSYPSVFHWSGTGKPSYSQAGLTEVLSADSHPNYLSGGFWTRNLLSSLPAGSFVEQEVLLETSQAINDGLVSEAEAASIRLRISSAQILLTIRSSGTGAPVRQFSMPIPSSSFAQYVSWEVNLNNPSQSKVWVDNVQRSSTSSGTLSTYPVTVAPAITGVNRARMSSQQVWWGEAAVWTGTTASASAPLQPGGWSDSDYRRKDFAIVNGRASGRQVYADVRGEASLGNLPWIPAVTWTPNRQDYDAWELLKEMCEAARATMFITAFGGLRIVPQVVMEELEQRASSSTWPKETVTADGMTGLDVRSNWDGVRTSIQFSSQDARAFLSAVYEASDANQFFTLPRPGAAGSFTVQDFEFAAPSDMINLGVGTFLQTKWPNGNGPELWGIEGVHFSQYDGWPPTDREDFTLENVDAQVIEVGRQDRIRVRIRNGHDQAVMAARSAVKYDEYASGVRRIPTAAALRAGGLKRVMEDVQVHRIGTGNRVLELPSSEFSSAPWSSYPTIQSMLNRASRYVPVADSFSLPGDPRRSLYDLITLVDPEGLGTTAVAQVIGRQTVCSPTDGFRQTLTVRLLYVPGEWLLGVTGFSELGSTTTLG